MRVLVVCQYYYPEPFRIPDICEALVQQGHTVKVITGMPNYPEGNLYPGYENCGDTDETVGGVLVHRCPIIPRKTGMVYRFLNYYSFVFSSWKYLRKMKEDYDVVFINQLSPVMMAEAGLRWAKKNKRKSVLYCLDLWPESLLVGGVGKSSPIYRFFLHVSKSIYRRADTILVSSNAFADYFRETLGIADKTIRWLPQYAEGLFDTLPEPQGKRKGLNVLLAGNIGTLQSVETVVEAARLLKDDPGIHIHIVGGGISLDKCTKMAEGLENITFHGRHDISEMPAFYAMADAMLVTLVKDPGLSANLPGKVQSYMAAGKPVIGSINGETARVIRDAECGLCSPAEDPAALANVMRQMAAEPEKLKVYGENARNYYHNNFRKEYFISELTKVLEETCRG